MCISEISKNELCNVCNLTYLKTKNAFFADQITRGEEEGHAWDQNIVSATNRCHVNFNHGTISLSNKSLGFYIQLKVKSGRNTEGSHFEGKGEKMIFRQYLCYAIVPFFPLYDIGCHELLRQKKSKIAISKRNVTMIRLASVPGWMAYANLVYSLFGGMNCGIYHVFILLIAPISIGPQLLRGVRLWGMMEYNKLVLERDELSNRNCQGLGVVENMPSIIRETSSSESQSCSQINDEQRIAKEKNRANSKKIKKRMNRWLQITRWGVLIVPTTFFIVLLLVTSDADQLRSRDFDECFPEPKVVTHIGRAFALFIAILALATTLLIRHCNDELGIRNEIQRNVLILLIMYLCIFVTRWLGHYEWESFLQSMKQILLSFSMIIMPCFHKLNFLTWTQNKGTQIVPKRAISSYGRTIPDVKGPRQSFMSRRQSQNEAAGRKREATMSLDAGLCILLSSKEGMYAFTEHCAREFSVENIKFWCTVNKYHIEFDMQKIVSCEKSIEDSETSIKAFVQEIYDIFIKPDAEFQINLPSYHCRKLEAIIKSNDKIERDLYDKAQKEIFSLMSCDSYPRFLASKNHGHGQSSLKTKQSLPTRRASLYVVPPKDRV